MNKQEENEEGKRLQKTVRQTQNGREWEGKRRREEKRGGRESLKRVLKHIVGSTGR